VKLYKIFGYVIEQQSQWAGGSAACCGMYGCGQALLAGTPHTLSAAVYDLLWSVITYSQEVLIFVVM